MKKINFDYTLYDKNGLLKKKGHINYSISHFIYALYQKNYTYQKNPKRPYIPKPKEFWDNFSQSLNTQQIGNIFFAFATNQPQFLNK